MGASIQSLYNLGKKKGLRAHPLHARIPERVLPSTHNTSTGFGIEDNSPEAIWPVPLGLVEDPTVIPPDKKFLVWNKPPYREEVSSSTSAEVAFPRRSANPQYRSAGPRQPTTTQHAALVTTATTRSRNSVGKSGRAAHAGDGGRCRD